MKAVSLFHNPDAGSSPNSSKHLVKRIKAGGFSCDLSSTDPKDVKKLIPNSTDFLAVAGGDGTVRKVTEELLKRKIIDRRFPVGILPLGTANNIARALGIETDLVKAIRTWKRGRTRMIDAVRISRLKKTSFFLEGAGFGIIPCLMKTMKSKDEKHATPETSIAAALRALLKVAETYQPRSNTVVVDGKKYKGRFLLAEVMNIPSIGPNLALAPDADPSDGWLDVVLVREGERKQLKEFIMNRIANGKDTAFPGKVIRAKTVEMTIADDFFHADDKYKRVKKERKIKMEICPGSLGFLV
jgi:YegS/Rv2252/BmrU family lipid kinase